MGHSLRVGFVVGVFVFALGGCVVPFMPASVLDNQEPPASVSDNQDVPASVSDNREVLELEDEGEENVPTGSLMTAAEKEALGYERPEGVPNPTVQRKALAHRDEIFAVVGPFVEEALGRRVELVGIDARYPYDAVNVIYRTTDEPIVASYVLVGLDGEGNIGPGTPIAPIEPGEIQNGTVAGLYAMAYRDELDRMREYLASAYPQYVGLPDGYMRFKTHTHPVLSPVYTWRPEDYTAIESASNAIYAAYRDNPHRPDAEWRMLFEDNPAPMSLAVFLMLEDPQVPPTEQMARDVGDDLQSNPLFDNFECFTINVKSNQMLRDRNDFHESITLSADYPPNWTAIHWVDGYTL